MSVPYPDITVIVGSGRSGTTYLAREVKQGLDIDFSGEPKFVVPMYRNLQEFGDLSAEANLRRLVERIHCQPLFRWLHARIGIPTRVEEILERVQEPTYTAVLYGVFQLLADKRGQSRLGYKDPADVVNLPVLAHLLPTARFVHVIRDGRDVALSLLKFLWGSTSVYCGARYWARTVGTARRDGAALADRYFELRLEDFIGDTDRVAAALAEFINRGDDPEQVRDFVDRVNRTKNPAIMYTWKQKMTPRQRYLAEAAAGDVLKACGYETEYDGKARVGPIGVAFYRATDFFHRVLNLARRRFSR